MSNYTCGNGSAFWWQQSVLMKQCCKWSIDYGCMYKHSLDLHLKDGKVWWTSFLCQLYIKKQQWSCLFRRKFSMVDSCSQCKEMEYSILANCSVLSRLELCTNSGKVSTARPFPFCQCSCHVHCRASGKCLCKDHSCHYGLIYTTATAPLRLFSSSLRLPAIHSAINRWFW